MSDQVEHGGRRTAGPAAGRAAGRHAVDEDAVLTPIFHALARGGVRGRAERAARPARSDDVAEFRRDPLTAPIPVQAFAAAAAPSAVVVTDRPRRRAAHARPDRPTGGRHARLAG